MRRWILLLGAAGLGACSFATDSFRLGGAQPDVPAGSDVPATDLGAPVDVPGAVDAADVPPATDVQTPADVPDVPAVADTGCGAGQGFCGGACVDTQASLRNCGGCDRACDNTNATAAACNAGRCEITCRDGFADCDGDPRNGCETSLTTISNCGRCRTACPAVTGANRVAACVMGACATACAAGFGDCDGMADNGCETDVNSTAQHCGRCGNRCRGHIGSTTNVCVNGGCAPTCNTGYSDCDRNTANGCEAATGTNAHCTACGATCGGLCTVNMGAPSCAPTAVPGYDLTMASAPFIDVCARVSATRVLPGQDDAAVLVTVPFPFRFWSVRPLTLMASITSNGMMSLDGRMLPAVSGILPDPAGPNGVIAPLWTDLRTSANNGVCHDVIGLTPNRRWVVQWRDATYFSGDPTSTLDFEATLFETTGVIEFAYRAVPAAPMGIIPTVGVESPNGAVGVAQCNVFGERCVLSTAQILRFTPQ